MTTHRELNRIKAHLRHARAEGVETVPVRADDLAGLYEELVRLRGARYILARIRAAMANHPEPSACDLHGAEGLITCGWKAAYLDVVKAAKEEK